VPAPNGPPYLAPDSSILVYYVTPLDAGQKTALDNVVAAHVPAAHVPVTAGQLIGIRLLTSTADLEYTLSAGATALVVQLVGGGAGGAGIPATSAGTAAAGGGGGAGGFVQRYITGLLPGTTFLYRCGFAGQGGAEGVNAGVAGSETIFDGANNYLQANGGSGGGSMNAGSSIVFASGGQGGTALGGDLNLTGMAGDPGFRLAGTASASASGFGGHTQFGTGGRRTFASGGHVATGYGAGGGGACQVAGLARPGGNGMQGVIYVWEYT
jgi:hypothetical protein